jgi:hypothetical protein
LPNKEAATGMEKAGAASAFPASVMDHAGSRDWYCPIMSSKWHCQALPLVGVP